MTAVLQIVKNAKVIADGEFSGEIGYGLYILLGVEKGDTEQDALLLADKIAKLRIFSDENGKMNLSVNDINGEAMIGLSKFIQPFAPMMIRFSSNHSFGTLNFL